MITRLVRLCNDPKLCLPSSLTPTQETIPDLPSVKRLHTKLGKLRFINIDLPGKKLLLPLT